MTLCDDIRELTARALWETENLIACIPDSLWEKRYDGLPMWKYVYHMLYSMDRWYINPCDPQYQDPSFHQKGLNDLNLMPKDERISRQEITTYEIAIRRKIESYLEGLEDAALGENPEGLRLFPSEADFGAVPPLAPSYGTDLRVPDSGREEMAVCTQHVRALSPNGPACVV